MRAGQGDRQLDQPQGGRGGLHRRTRARCAATARPPWSWPSTSRARRTRVERKVAICARAYRILTEQVGFPAEDIIFDPNIFAIATGIEEHNGYGVAFIEATRRIKQKLPHALVSGGVSNVSFSFRGNDPVREAMHSVFLYHAIAAGMDMGIVNAGQLAIYEQIQPELREACEDVVLNRRADATERLLRDRRALQGRGRRASAPRTWSGASCRWPSASSTRSSRASTTSSSRIPKRRASRPTEPLAGDRRTADGRHECGRRPVWLRQDVPAAGGEERARHEARGRAPACRSSRRSKDGTAQRANGRIVMATVKGDVHDIGKNIVGVVLQCNNFEVIDLGVMVPCEKILETARREQVDFIGLSGLITPSLDEMVHVAQGDAAPELRGAAADRRCDDFAGTHLGENRPAVQSPVVYVKDASRAVGCLPDAHPRRRSAQRFIAQGRRGARAPPRAARRARRSRRRNCRIAQARANRRRIDWAAYCAGRAARRRACSASMIIR